MRKLEHNKMEKLFIWYYTTNNLPKGIPVPLETSIVETYNPKKPMQDFNFPWVRYKYMLMPFPPEVDKLKLPENLSLVMKNEKEPKFDFLNKKGEYKIVSEKLLQILKESGLNSNYETAKLTLLNKKGEDVSNQVYFLLRFARFDDELFDFNEETKVPSAITNTFLYPDLKLKTQTDKGVFVMESFCYKDCLIINEKVKAQIENECYLPEIYTVKDFPKVFNGQMNAWKK